MGQYSTVLGRARYLNQISDFLGRIIENSFGHNAEIGIITDCSPK
jgi:hypothetical protein